MFMGAMPHCHHDDALKDDEQGREGSKVLFVMGRLHVAHLLSIIATIVELIIFRGGIGAGVLGA